MDDRYIAVLGGGQDSLEILTRIRRMGLKTIVCDKDRDAPSKGLADIFVPVSCYNEWEVTNWFSTNFSPALAAVICAGTEAVTLTSSMTPVSHSRLLIISAVLAPSVMPIFLSLPKSGLMGSAWSAPLNV